MKESRTLSCEHSLRSSETSLGRQRAQSFRVVSSACLIKYSGRAFRRLPFRVTPIISFIAGSSRPRSLRRKRAKSERTPPVRSTLIRVRMVTSSPAAASGGQTQRQCWSWWDCPAAMNARSLRAWREGRVPLPSPFRPAVSLERADRASPATYIAAASRHLPRQLRSEHAFACSVSLSATASVATFARLERTAALFGRIVYSVHGLKVSRTFCSEND